MHLSLNFTALLQRLYHNWHNSEGFLWVFLIVPCWPPSNYLHANSESVLSQCIVLLTSRCPSLWLRRAEAATFPRASALIPGLSTTSDSTIKVFGEFTTEMFLNSWQTLWKSKKMIFNTKIWSSREQLLALKSGWQMKQSYLPFAFKVSSSCLSGNALSYF